MPGPMIEPRPLRFAVHGVARSGTTALADALNLEPSVFCAGEFFRDVSEVDHARLRLPADFLDEASALAEPRKALAARRVLRKKLERGEVAFYGNKQPEYVRVMGLLRRQDPPLRHICIYRSPVEIARSWQRRADDPGDDMWPPGRGGVIGVYDWLLLMARLAEPGEDVLVADYTTLFRRDATLVLGLLDHIGVARPDPGFAAAFREEVFQGPEAADREKPADAFSALAEVLDLRAIDARFAAAPLAMASGVAADLRGFLADSDARILDFLVETLAARGDPVAIAHAKDYACRRIRSWDDPGGPTFAMLRRHLVLLVERLHRVAPGAGARSTRRLASLLRDPVRGAEASERDLLRTALREVPLPPEDRQGAEGIGAARPAATREAHLHLARARDLEAGGRLQEAMAALRQALALEAGRQPRYLLFHAQLLRRAGRAAEAAEAMREVVRAEPDKASHHLALSRDLVRAGLEAEALAAADRAREIAPKDSTVADWVARLEARRGRRPDAPVGSGRHRVPRAAGGTAPLREVDRRRPGGNPRGPVAEGACRRDVVPTGADGPAGAGMGKGGR